MFFAENIEISAKRSFKSAKMSFKTSTYYFL